MRLERVGCGAAIIASTLALAACGAGNVTKGNAKDTGYTGSVTREILRLYPGSTHIELSGGRDGDGDSVRWTNARGQTCVAKTSYALGLVIQPMNPYNCVNLGGDIE